jgi:hypothetical protein
MSEATTKEKGKNFTDPRDGVEFINISAIGNTELGRFLSNSSHSKFTHPEYGSFESMIGFWKWYCAKDRESVNNAERINVDRLRTMYGRDAIAHAKNHVKQCFVKSFRQVIAHAIWYKIIANQKMVELMVENKLPYISVSYKGDKNVLVSNPNSDWLVPIYESIAKHLAENGVDVEYSYSYPDRGGKRSYGKKK